VPRRSGQKERHHQLIVPPDEHVPEVILPGGPQLPHGGPAASQSLAPGHVNGFDLLHGHGAASHVHGAATAVLIVLALPDQLSPHPGEGMRVVGAIADGLTVDPLTFISAAILLVLMFLGLARIMDLIFPGVIFETSFLFPMLLHE
jgi:hypothetical protein